MMISVRSLLLGLSLGLVTLPALASETGEDTPSRLGVGVHLGFNIGGALPPTVPQPVKKVTAFKPGGTPNVGLDFSYRLTPTSPFSLLMGVEYDIRSFSSTVLAENMPIRYQSEDHREQHFSGYQRVEMDTRYLVLPVGVSYTLPHSSFRLMAGGYYAYALKRKFTAKLDGDGLMDGRTYQEGSILSFSLGDFLVRNDVGVRFGADYQIDPHWGLTARMNVGLPKIFDKDFEVMPYSLRHVFLNLGVSYRINR